MPFLSLAEAGRRLARRQDYVKGYLVAKRFKIADAKPSFVITESDFESARATLAEDEFFSLPTRARAS